MAGPRRVPRGQKSSVENPGRVMKRLLGYIFKYYGYVQILLISVLILYQTRKQIPMRLMKAVLEEF